MCILTAISYKIDTGAQCNVTSVERLQNTSLKVDLQPVNAKCTAYNDSKIPVVSKCSLTPAQKSNSSKVLFVVDSDPVSIFRLKTRWHLQLIKRICGVETNNETFFSEFHDCFGEIGTLNTAYHTEVKGNVKPVVACL